MFLDFVLNTKKEYEEKLEELKLTKEENKKEIKNIEKAKKLVEKLGVTALIEDCDSMTVEEYDQLEKDIKLCKAILTRLDTVLKMFNDNSDIIEVDVVSGEMIETY